MRSGGPRFRQYTGEFVGHNYVDECMKADMDGDLVCCRLTEKALDDCDVTVLIPLGAYAEVTVRLLEKITAMIRESGLHSIRLKADFALPRPSSSNDGASTG